MKKWIPALLAGALLAVATAQADKTAGDVVDDNTVNASVKAALIENKTTKANNINVETYKGVVQLSGFVETAAEKQEAGRVAAGVDGVKSVSNNISIGSDTSMGTKLDDSVTTGIIPSRVLHDVHANYFRAKELEYPDCEPRSRWGPVLDSGCRACRQSPSGTCTP